MEPNPFKIILAFGKSEQVITDWMIHNRKRLDDKTIIVIVQKRHQYMGLNTDQKEIECVHCGSWESQSYNLYLEAMTYYNLNK